MTRRFTVDSNILVYAADIDAGPRHRAAAVVLERALDANFLLLTQTAAEFYRAATRKGRARPDDAAAFVRAWLDTYETVSWNEADLRAAIAVSGDGRLSLFDALIVATARRAGCSVLLSEDMQDGSTAFGVEIVNPFRAGAALPWLRQRTGK